MGYVHPLPSVLLLTWEKEVVLLKQLDVCAHFPALRLRAAIADASDVMLLT
jgi:hypothetical protein